MDQTKKRLLWLGLMILAALLIVIRVQSGVGIETNILKALPESTGNENIIDVARVVVEQQSKTLLYLVESKSLESSIGATRWLKDQLLGLPIVTSVRSGMDSADAQSMLALYDQHPGLTLPSAFGTAESALDHIKSMLFSPGATPVGRLLEKDPLLLSVARMKELSSLGSLFKNKDGISYLEDQGRFYGFLEIELKESPFLRSAQTSIALELQKVERSLAQQYSDISLFEGGALKFALYAGETSESDVKRISIGASIAVSALLYACFRSIVLTLLAIIPIVSGIVFGAAALLLCFDSIHVISLAFGSSLIGIAVDYCIHYFLNPTTATYSSIRRGLITTIIGFSALYFAPFEGIKQMAVFSIVGLIAAFVAIGFLFSSQWLTSLRKPALPKMFALYFRLCVSRWWFTVVLGAVVIALLVVVKLPSRINDDVRLLQQIPSHIQEEEEHVRRLLGGLDTSQFLLVRGQTIEELFETLHKTRRGLDRLLSNKQLASYLSLASFYSPPTTQRENLATLSDYLKPGAPIVTFYDSIGLHNDSISSFRAKLKESQPIELSTFLDSPFGKRVRHLWLGKRKGEYFNALLLLSGVENSTSLETIASEFPNVFYMNQAQQVSDLFSTYREHISYLLGAAAVVIFVLLSFLYGVKNALKMVLIPANACLMALLGCIILGITINIFVLLGLILVSAIGIDYVILLQSEESHDVVFLGNALSAITTISAFGLLALSSMPALSAFGATLCIGILSALLLCPCSVGDKSYD